MFVYPDINPIFFNFCGFSIRWYGFCYLLGFLGAYIFLLSSAKQNFYKNIWNNDKIIDLLMLVAIGVIIGGRAGYVLFYQPSLLIQNPLEIFKFWAFGRSFHAGMLGVIIALLFFCKYQKLKFWYVADFLVPVIPIGIFFGRIGNFINGELWGRPVYSKLALNWAMVFPHVDSLPRHPSQLYEALLEGMVLFILLFYLSRKAKIVNKVGLISSIFLLGYGILRIICEFFRESDVTDLYFLNLTMGQILSVPMIIAGVILLYASLSGFIKKNN